MTKEEIEELFKPEDGAILIEPCEVYGDAIIGISEDKKKFIYDYHEMVAALAEDYRKNCKDDAVPVEQFYDEAVEWIEYNTLRELQYKDSEYKPVVILSKGRFYD